MKIVYFSFYLLFAASLDCSSLPSQNITIDVSSDLDDWVVGNLNPNGAYAVPIFNNYTRSVAPFGLRIWESAYPYDPKQNITCYIGKSFYVPGIPFSATIKLNADDKCLVKMNNQDTGCNTTNIYNVKTCNVNLYVMSGLNSLNITVINYGANIPNNPGFVNYWLSIQTTVKSLDYF